MVNFEFSEEVLRGRVLEAQRQFSAVRAAIAAEEVTPSEGEYVYQAALSQYAQALRRFSDLTVYGHRGH